MIKKHQDVEVFAIGAGGYGTLQELLLLRRYVLYLFCNFVRMIFSWETEDSFIVRNQKNFRPYLVKGSIRYRPAYIYRFLKEYSKLFRAFDGKLQNFQYRLYGGYRPKYLTAPSESLDNAEAITLDLLKQLVASVPVGTRLATFNCLSKDPDLETRWIRAAGAAGFVVWPEVARKVDAEEEHGTNVRAIDGQHWNRRGHEIAGLEVCKKLSGLLAESQSHCQ